MLISAPRFSVILNNTLNFGVDAAQGCDYINVCGNYSNLCGGEPVSLEAPEGLRNRLISMPL
jgi:hypothetical protein